MKNKSTNVAVFYSPANTTPVLQLLNYIIDQLLVEYLMNLDDNEKEYTSITISYNEHRKGVANTERINYC